MNSDIALDAAHVLLADDHALVRAGLKRVLQDEFGANVIAEAGDAPELWTLAAAHRADVIVTDVSMPGASPAELVRGLARQCPGTPVLLVTMHKDAALAAQMLAAGAAGYLAKDKAYPMLGLAIHKLRRGGRFVDPDLLDDVLALRSTLPAAAPHDALSPRESEILRLIAAGRPLKEIAHALAISPKTVTSHKTRVMSKLGVRSTAALIRYTVERRLFG